MKRTLTIIAFLMLSMLAFAQRTDYCSVKADSKDYQVFSFKDADGTLGDYLSLGSPTCIYIGSNAAEAQRTLNSLVNLVDSPEGTVQEFQARTLDGGQLGKFGTMDSVDKEGRHIHQYRRQGRHQIIVNETFHTDRCSPAAVRRRRFRAGDALFVRTEQDTQGHP